MDDQTFKQICLNLDKVKQIIDYLENEVARLNKLVTVHQNRSCKCQTKIPEEK